MLLLILNLASILHTKPIYLLSATRSNMLRLIMLRSVVMLCLIMVIFGLSLAGIPLHIAPLCVGVALLGLLNTVAWWRLKQVIAPTERELLLQLLGDIAVFSLIFYVSGGYSNPFIWMYLLPITVAAVALRARYAWLVAILSIASYTLLMFYHIPLSHLHMHMNNSTRLDIHLVGMWMGFVVSAVIVAIFIARIGQNLRDYDQKMADVREKALESERMLSLGTLAASAAHELGTPLATMAVISKELTQELAQHPDALAQLNIMRTQITRCKEILSSITQNAGQTRANAGQGLPLLDFLNEAIQRWRDTQPSTELVVNMTKSTVNPTIFADITLTQALLNLLDNAAEASPERVLLDANWNQEHLTIQIRDFGKGLSPEVKQKLGTPFFSSKPVTDDKQGLGLGVFLTQNILARYEGRLSHINHADGGVLTTIHLPLKLLKVT
jgi:two-component system sensor histidine kinase RegB